MQFYRASGLSVASEFALPGLIPGAPERKPQVGIRLGAVPESLPQPTASGPTWQMAGRRFLLRIPNVARFLLNDGREIVVAPEPEADVVDVALFTLASAFGILLHQREQIVLHGSAVRVGKKAVLFCGPSGAGKSTMAAALAQRGFPLVSEDICVVTISDSGTPLVHPDARQLKLWAQSINKLDLAGRRGERVRASLEKFYVDSHEAFSEPFPLGALYALREARPPLAPGIERPNVVDAALVLRRNAYRPLVVRQMNQKANYFRAAAAIANAAGIFHLTRALDFARIPEVIAWLETQWVDIGLMEGAA